MKSVVLLILLIIGSCANSFPQSDTGKLSSGNHEKFSRVKNKKGRDMVLFVTKDWDALMFNTKYISDSLPLYSIRKIYIEIADKKNGLCNKGIGFGCSIFDYTEPYNRGVFNVDQENRLCVALLSKTKTRITLELLSKVNWNNLQ